MSPNPIQFPNFEESQEAYIGFEALFEQSTDFVGNRKA